ncbi:MAG: hypothetical protein IPH09_02680 [bacterium]|nr:hypothetical protein [bacterium]
MLCLELSPELCRVTGAAGVEQELRRRGVHMIHGGRNGLRFTPHFGITAGEVALILGQVRRCCDIGPSTLTRRSRLRHVLGNHRLRRRRSCLLIPAVQ